MAQKREIKLGRKERKGLERERERKEERDRVTYHGLVN